MSDDTREIPCTAPGVWYAGTHLEAMPRSYTAGVLYCARCLGFGTVRVPVHPCAVPAAHHSADLVAVHSGTVEPVMLCGFHASEPNIADSFRRISREA